MIRGAVAKVVGAVEAEILKRRFVADCLPSRIDREIEELTIHGEIVKVHFHPVPFHYAGQLVAEDAKAAVDCALAISDRLEQMNQDWRCRGLPVIQMRIGIFTGPVVVGSLGGKDRLEYGVIGDSVNIASRLESCEKHRQPTPCRILIGQQTLDQLQGEFEVESWGPLALKGKQQTVNVYRVLARSTVLEYNGTL